MRRKTKLRREYGNNVSTEKEWETLDIHFMIYDMYIW